MLVRIGTKRLFEMTVGAGVGPMMSSEMEGYGLRRDELLRHSVWTAAASEELARELGIPAPDMVFTAGLLHDIGKIVMDPIVEENREALLSAAEDGDASVSFEKVEHDVLGMNHAEAGAAILEHWHFPAAISDVVRWHHEPEMATEHVRLANLVHVATIITTTGGVGAGFEGLHYKVSFAAAQDLGIKTKVLEVVAGRTLEIMERLEKVLA